MAWSRGVTRSGVGVMWRRAAVWLNQISVGDPVDRRNAPFFQVLMVLMGTLVVLNWAYLQFVVGMPQRRGGMTDVAMSLVTAVAAWCAFFLVRHGRFRDGVRLFLGAEVISQLIAYAATGLHAQLSDPTIPVLLVVLGGLMLGRRTLWWMFALLMVIFATGAVTDALHRAATGEDWLRGISGLPHILLRYLVFAVIIDRCVAALRHSLDESISRGHALTRANRRLRHEMAERERVHEQLVHAQKMEAVGRLAGGAAHDFNHVLSIILGYAGQRRRLAAEGGEAWMKALKGIETAARRGAAICRKLLNFSRQDVSRTDIFDAGAALRELRPMLVQMFDEPVRVDVCVDENAGALPICFDRGQFELIILNIAANARDALPDGGHFRVHVSRRASDDSVGITLRDDGTGMTPQVAERIFEPFFTTKAVDNGTGLGLAVVCDLLNKVHGGIRVESSPGGGSCFHIRMPLATEAESVCAD